MRVGEQRKEGRVGFARLPGVVGSGGESRGGEVLPKLGSGMRGRDRGGMRGRDEVGVGGYVLAFGLGSRQHGWGGWGVRDLCARECS